MTSETRSPNNRESIRRETGGAEPIPFKVNAGRGLSQWPGAVVSRNRRRRILNSREGEIFGIAGVGVKAQH